jgi:UDP-N-acetylmuramoylalanine--D-glutamate ligase
VATIDGIEFINDTAATAPAAAIASLRSLDGRRVHLIAGGADKRLPLDGLADEIAARAASVVLLDGTATPLLRELLERGGRISAGEIATDMESAVRRAVEGAARGDAVLLSPGCASFGLFRDEFDRGDQFCRQVRSLMPVGARV